MSSTYSEREVRSDGTRAKGILGVDFDQTLTAEPPRVWEPGAEWPAPDEEMIEAVTEAWKDGMTIIIWSARRWVEAPYLIAWLEYHGVPYHGLRLGKGAADTYIDDKASTPEDMKAYYRSRKERPAADAA
jgi:hypothetical protein